MAATTRLDPSAAARLLAAWNVGTAQITALPGKGTVNSNFEVRAASGRRFFLRINEGKTREDAEAEAALLVELARRGVPTPALLPATDGSLTVDFGGKPASLFPWLHGQEAWFAADDLAGASLAGGTLGRLHLRTRDLAQSRLPRNHYTLGELERRLERARADAHLCVIVPRLDAELDRARSRDRGPTGLIHQDLFPDNVLVDEAGQLVALLDFEQATSGPLIYDLAVALNAWCWDGVAFVAATARRLVAAYEVEAGRVDRRLLLDEARLAAARFTITRITDVHLKPDVDPDLRARKDYRDFLRRLDWWHQPAGAGLFG